MNLSFTGNLKNIINIFVKGENQNYVIKGDLRGLDSIPVYPLDTVIITQNTEFWRIKKENETIPFIKSNEFKFIVPHIEGDGILSFDSNDLCTIINLSVLDGCSGFILKVLEDYSPVKCPKCRETIKYIKWKETPYKFSAYCPYCKMNVQLLNSNRM